MKDSSLSIFSRRSFYLMALKNQVQCIRHMVHHVHPFYIITDNGDFTRPTKRQLQINMITALPPTEPAVTSEIKSWFSMFLSLVLDASRLVSSPLGLWGAGWIVRFDWVVCEEKMSGKKIWLIEWERAVRVILASSPATAESRASEQSKAHIFKTNHFFMVTFSVSNYYLLKKEFILRSLLTLLKLQVNITDNVLHIGIDFYVYIAVG